MTALMEKRKKVSACFDQGIQLASKLGSTTTADNLRKIKDAFEKKEITVVTVGEMRRGKSSLLNALLEEQDPLFPVDINVCTNVVTIVGYGEKETVEVLFSPNQDLRSLQTKEITRAEIPDYVSERGNPNNYKNVSVLNIRIPHPLLKDGVRFVDTPGVGSLNISHAETTYGFLPNADLFLFVSDTSAGLTETELSFLKKGYRYCKNVVFPLTKKDLNPNYEEIVNDNRAKISQALEIPETEVEIIPVSSTAKMRALHRNLPAMLKTSNFAALEEAIWRTIENKRSEILFLPFIEEAKQELYKMAENVAAQYQLLKTGKGKLTEYAQKLSEENEKLRNLKKNSTQWKTELSHRFELMRNGHSAAVGRIKQQAYKTLDDCCNAYGVKLCE